MRRSVPALSLVSQAAAPPQHDGAETPDPASVVVLPFEVLGRPDDAALLAVGLHTDLLTELSRIRELKVISRHSAMKYDGSDAPLERIARDLGVAMVLTGWIQAAGPRFRLAVQLVDAAAGVHRWAESYDKELSTHNLLAVQQDLASDIAAALSRRLGTAAVPTTDSLEAYRLVVERRMQFDRKTEEGLAAAVESFERAVVVDPDYGLAWTGLADALAMTADYGYGNRDALLSAAESAVVRALALLPGAAEIHTSLGLIAEGRHDAPKALSEYEKAIQLRPGHADAHSWHAWVSLTLGDAQRALPFTFRVPPIDAFPAEFHGQQALDFVVFRTDPTAVDSVASLQSLGTPIVNAVGPMEYTRVQQTFDPNLPAGQRYYSTAHDIAAFTDAAIADFARFVRTSEGAFTASYFEPRVRAAGRVDAAATAMGGRDATYGFHVIAGWSDAEDDASVMAWAREFSKAMSAHATGGVYVNLIADDENDRISSAFSDANRVTDLKRAWDPDNVLHGNHNVVPPGP